MAPKSIPLATAVQNWPVVVLRIGVSDSQITGTVKISDLFPYLCVGTSIVLTPKFQSVELIIQLDQIRTVSGKVNLEVPHPVQIGRASCRERKKYNVEGTSW